MTPAKSRDQDGGRRGVCGITEKAQFPSFQLYRRMEPGAWERQRRLPEKKLRFGGSKLEACDMLSPLQDPKMEILASTWQPVPIGPNLHH